MKKYCIVIGNDEDLSEKVQYALFDVGFEWIVSGKCVAEIKAPMIILNEHSEKRMCSARSAHLVEHDNELIHAKYAIDHAHELDGAMKPWEIAPKGYRIVTADEEREHDCPDDCVAYWWREDVKRWAEVLDTYHWNNPSAYDCKAFAIPEDYEFRKEPTVTIGGKEFSESTVKAALKAYTDGMDA